MSSSVYSNIKNDGNVNNTEQVYENKIFSKAVYEKKLCSLFSINVRNTILSFMDHYYKFDINNNDITISHIKMSVVRWINTVNDCLKLSNKLLSNEPKQTVGTLPL